MANQNFSRNSGKGKFAYLGVDLRNPPDLMRQGRAPYLLNVSPNVAQGALQARAGTTAAGSTGVNSPIHSLKRVNNSVPGAANPWLRFAGAGANLYAALAAAPNTYSSLGGGYSGKPLSLVPYRPPQSPETWLYAFDSAQQKKYRSDGATVQNVGILPPTAAPTVRRGAPQLNTVLDAGTGPGWTSSGTAGAPAYTARVTPDGSITVSAILYDSGTNGWCSVVPSGAQSAFGAGMRVIFSGASEQATVWRVFPALTGTTVRGILFDAGSTGMCTIVPDISMQGLQRNALISVAGHYTRVLSVTEGPDGQYSFRCSLSSTAGTGSAILIPFSFRVLTLGTHVTGEVLHSYVLQSACTAGTGLIYNSTTVAPLDLTQLMGLSDRPVTADDYMHCSLQIDNPANITEIHLLLDVDQTANDFNHNYYYFVIRQNDFQQILAGGQSIIDTNLAALSNEIASTDLPDAGIPNAAQSPYPVAALGSSSPPSPAQMAPGNSQWFEAIFKINDLTRVGSDLSAGLNNVKGLGVLVIASGSANVSFGSWWVEGGYGPDCNFNSYGNQGQPILYRYRYRSSLTGAISDVSPATRNGDLPMRNPLIVFVTASPDPQCDLIDIERNGGTTDTWHRCLTVANVTAEYADTVEEDVAAAGDPLELLQYAPWPVTDRPRSGVCNISGTWVNWVSGDTFNVNWIRGVEFIVNNQTYTLYAPPHSTATLETAESIGTFTNVPFIIPEATIAGQPLPYVCGPFDGRTWAAGDPYNPGLLYFSNPYNPDSASDQGYIEVTSPSEPLLMPVVYEGAVYVFSAQAVYRVESTPGKANPYAAYKHGAIPSGLAAPWAVNADGPLLVWLGSDGIYGMAANGAAESLTKDDLTPLFPIESRPGLPVVIGGATLYPPDLTQQQWLRVSYAYALYFFDYKDTQGNFRSLTLDPASKGWVPYQYAAATVALHYEEEGIADPATLCGKSDGTLSVISGAANDEGTAFNCAVITPADDQGETRARKQYGDLILDYSLGATTAEAVAAYYDNFLLAGPSFTAAVAATRTQEIFDLYWTALHRNIGLVITWASGDGMALYEWQPSYIPDPEDTIGRPTDWADAGTIHYKFIHGCRIQADTGGVSRTVQVQYDGGLIGPTLTVNHTGELVLPYSFPPFKARLLRLVPTDPNEWRLWGVQWEFDIEPDPADYWVTQPTTFGFSGYAHIRDFLLAYASVNAGANLLLIVDGVSNTLAANLPATGGNEVKSYFAAPPLKGKLFQLYLLGSQVQIYLKDCEFRMKQWGQDQYQVLRPLGDDSVTSGGARL